MLDPFRYFNSSPEVIRLVVMMYVKYPLSLRNVEDLLFERGTDICHETVRLWWNRFGPMFASEIRRKRVQHMRAYTHWRWHLDEVYVKINGEMRYLWRAVDHEGEVLDVLVTKERDKAAALKLMKRLMKRRGRPLARHRRAQILWRRHERDRQPGPPGGGPLAQQQGGKLTPTVPATRAGDAQISEDENTPEVRLGPRPGPQSFQPGAPPHQPGTISRETLRRPGRVAGGHGLRARTGLGFLHQPETRCR
jgi:hypothetical protein